MLKKIALLAATFSLASCVLFAPKDAPIPAEFAGADYQITDIDAQRWAAASRQVEQCVYPNLTRIQQQHFAKEDAYIHSQYVFFYPLEDVIGEKFVKMVQNDEKSMNFATYQYKRFAKNVQFEPLKTEQCEALRTQARDDLAVVKGQYKSGMTEEKKAVDGKNPDGVATNQNKFFFDIIKWGSALLL